MNADRKAKYQWGQRVESVPDLYNDGSCPQWPLQELRVCAGAHGEIVRAGHTCREWRAGISGRVYRRPGGGLPERGDHAAMTGNGK